MIGNSMKNQMILRGASLMALALLTACGGGGGGTSTTPPVVIPPVATTCPGGEIGFPVCYAPGKLQQALPSLYAVNSNEYAIFTEWNNIRSQMKLGPVNQNKSLDSAAQNHANYLQKSWISGEDGHLEVAGRLGFTGVTPLDRMISAGYTNAKYGGEDMGSKVGKQGFYGLMNAIYHRQALLDDWITDAGMISTALTGSIINFTFSTPQQNDGNYIGMYPYDGETSVSLTHSLESPNPFAGEMDMTLANMCTKTSVPVSVLSESTTTLKVTSFTIKEYGSDKDLSVRLMKQENGIRQNHAVIIANAPFKQFQRYEVKFIGKVTGGRSGNGFEVVKNWSFTTGTDINTCNF